MKEKEPWIKKFRQRMDGYEEPVPADLWSQLEQELQPAPRHVFWTRRWQSAAAVALLLMTSTLTVWFWQLPSADYLQRQSAELLRLADQVAGRVALDSSSPVSEGETTKTSGAVPASSESTETPRTDSAGAVSSVRLVAMELCAQTSIKTTVKPIETDKHLCETELDRGVQEEGLVHQQAVQVEAVSDEDESSAVQPKAKRTASPSRTLYTAAYSSVSHRRSTEAKGWSIGISTGNGSLSASYRSDGYLPLPKGVQGTVVNNSYGIQTLSEIDKLVQFKNLSEGKAAESEIDYKMPVVFGASLRFDLDADWAVETGLTYTMLASETRSGTAKNHYGWKDKLHYVGILVKVHRRLWSSRRLELYASAGGAVEKCVSGKRTLMGSVSTLAGGPDEKVAGSKEDLDVNPLQWSLSAAAGVQWKLNSHWGLYAEPGVAYYFDDGSSVETIRKEHPLQLNLQLGLRFTLPQ